MSAQSRVEEILENILGELDYLPTPHSRVEELLVLLKDTIDFGGGGGYIYSKSLVSFATFSTIGNATM